MNRHPNSNPKGRGAPIRPPNRFEPIHAEDDFEHLAADPEWDADDRSPRTAFIADESKSIVSENQSPDVGFRYSLNPYRGCEHGCAYCYARPTHEYYGLSAGLDFETQIFVKHRAPELFRQWLSNRDEAAEGIMFSGVTDCYQPAERRYQLTRGCLQVASDAGQPISIVTKNALVARDLDVLGPMAHRRIASVAVSITTLDAGLARVMEPRTSPPAARLRTIEALSNAGVPVRAMLAPIIPGLNDSEIPALLEAVRAAGAAAASYVLLRLPLTVLPVFTDWLERTQPAKKDRVLSLVRSTRGGKLNDARFGSRMRGSGQIAEQIGNTFRLFARKHHLDGPMEPLDTTQFRPPPPASGQLSLF